MKIKDIKNFPKAKEIIGQPDRIVEAIKYGYNLALKEVGELKVPRLDEGKIEKLISDYFIFEKRIGWFKKSRFGRSVLLSKVDSDFLAKALTTAYNKGELFKEGK